MAQKKLNDREIGEYLRFAHHLAEIGGRVILPNFRAALDVENKIEDGSFYDPVTRADRDAEAAIREEIARVYPGHGILGEEHGTLRGSEDLTWVIDPIDGTRAFILGLLHWGTLIALNDGTGPVVGVMHQPYTKETFVGSRLGGEFRYGGETKPLRVRKCARLEDAVVAATDPGM